eukprot:scaffold551_cov395-Prasinococcus_capsulatus_cf.AAC.7
MEQDLPCPVAYSSKKRGCCTTVRRNVFPSSPWRTLEGGDAEPTTAGAIVTSLVTVVVVVVVVVVHDSFTTVSSVSRRALSVSRLPSIPGGGGVAGLAATPSAGSTPISPSTGRALRRSTHGCSTATSGQSRAISIRCGPGRARSRRTRAPSVGQAHVWNTTYRTGWRAPQPSTGQGALRRAPCRHLLATRRHAWEEGGDTPSIVPTRAPNVGPAQPGVGPGGSRAGAAAGARRSRHLAQQG